MIEAAETIATRIVAETEATQRDLLACGAGLRRAVAGVERALTRGAAAGPGAPAAGAAARPRAAAGALDRASAAPIAAPGRAARPDAATPLREAMAALPAIDLGKFEAVGAEQLALIGKIGVALRDDLASGLAEAIVAGRSLGDVLVDSFARAGAALIRSQITRLLGASGGAAGDWMVGDRMVGDWMAGDWAAGVAGSVADALAGLVGARRAPRRASGGQVSAGRLYRVNEGGVEGFEPAGSGRIVPLGQMAAALPAGGVTLIQPLNVSFAGAITTPELMAQFKAYADGVGQAAVIGGAAMAQARMARRAARALPR